MIVSNDRKLQTMAICIIIASLLVFIWEVNVAFARDYSDWLWSCNAHKATVQAILMDEGVSVEYYYLMVAESRCKENAESKAGARGFWQLMPATGRRFGCNDLYEITCSTHAAAKYIKSLEARFNTFEEVIVAYNMGGHNYQKHGKSAQALGLVRRVRMIQKADQ